MTQSEQMKLVLLYALHEVGGGGKRAQVLQHINDQHYWYKDDANDARGRIRRHEPRWRNYFSFERLHLVDDGDMQPGGGGNWFITASGETRLCQLIGLAQNMPAGQARLFTPEFYQKIISAPLTADGPSLDEEAEEAAEAQYIARVAAEDMDAAGPAAFSNEPEERRPAHIAGERRFYPRDPAVARRALARANHRCEADPAHGSFLRRSGHVLYMEPHHLIPLSFTDYFGVNLDREQNIVSLCSNCHNQIHYGTKEDVRELLAKLFLPRARELCSILGKEIGLEDIYRIYGIL